MAEFQTVLMWFSLAAVGFLSVVGAVMWCRVRRLFPGRRELRAFRRLPRYAQFLLAVFVLQLIVHGSTKTNSVECASSPLGTNLTNTASSGLRSSFLFGSGKDSASPLTDGTTISNLAVSNLNVRGAWDDTFRLCFAAGWVFPFGTNHLGGVQVDTQGKVRPWWNATNAIASLGVPLAIVPGVTTFAADWTTNNSYLVSWTNGAANRDTNTLVTAGIELFRNGDTLVTTNGVVRFTPREIPFPHDGFGQDDDWVRANFTNAEEILSIGYENWLDAQVGVGLTNGLYKFTATFPSAPPEATRLTVGDLFVCVTNAGDYVFLLEKGVEYSFDTNPFDESVEYAMQDDIAPDAPVFVNAWWGGADYGEWTVDGGWHWLDWPMYGCPGFCLWMPTLQGSPDVVHIYPKDCPKEFSAILTDYAGRAPVSFEWGSYASSVSFSDPNAQTTLVNGVSFPSWDYLMMSVSADLCGYSLCSYLYASYGTNDSPQVSFALTTPEVVFLNDDDRTSRWYSVTLSFSCPVETNAIFTFAHSGETGLRFAADAEGEDLLTWQEISRRLASIERDSPLLFYMACSNLAEGTFTATCTLPSGEVQTRTRSYKVIEPLRKLVCTDSAPDGSIVNPSRLVYGTNAWLQVGLNGGFDLDDVAWRIVSGPGEFVTVDRNWACVRATDTTGVVIVEAAFGSDALIQPRFVLPIVEKRKIPVRACVIADDAGVAVATQEQFDGKLRCANEIFSQVGIELYRSAPVQVISNSSHLVMAACSLVTNRNGRINLSRQVSNQALDLIGEVQSDANEEFKLFWVDRIFRGTSIAFCVTNKNSCIFSNNQQASDGVFAHEIGHLFGLEDVYDERRNGRERLPQGDLSPCAEIFSECNADWVGDDGRGFYGIDDSHCGIIRSLLMSGADYGGTDIPSGAVTGYSERSRNLFDVKSVPVGASAIIGGR